MHGARDDVAWVRRLAFRYAGGDPDVADDLAQEAMIAVWDQGWLHSGPPRPWVGGVLRNLARMRHRSGARRRYYESAAQPDGGPPLPDQLLESAQITRIVSEALAALDRPQRETVELRYLREMSSGAIAREVGVPAGTVRRCLQGALCRMRAQLSAAAP